MGPSVALLNEDLEAPRVVESSLGSIAVFTRRCPGSESVNEDSALVFHHEDGVVLSVADGAGGGQDGDKASRMAIAALRESLEGNKDSLRTAILDAFELANQRVLALGTGAGTTLSVVELQPSPKGPLLRSYHAGDSSVLVTGGRGKVKLSTIPHSPVGYGVEAGLIAPTDALHHDDLNLVSNLVGITDMRIEMSSLLRLAPLDAMILGTDGLFDNLHSMEVKESARRGSVLESATRLLKLSTGRMIAPTGGNPSKPDDLSFIVFRPLSTKARSS
jgi:PPM family protein phosphatase